MIVYTFEDATNLIYVGSSCDVPVRIRQHVHEFNRAKLGKKTRTHYQKAKTALQQRFYLLWRSSENVTIPRPTIELIEALFIGVLNTHHSSILFSHAALSNVGNHPTALSINLPSSLVDQGRRKQESPDSAALRHAYNIAVASTLSIIFQNACRRAGWEGLDRQCHNHQVVNGANFSNPLAVGSGQDDQPTWFYSRAPGMSIYRRNAMTWRYRTAEREVPFVKEIRIAGIKFHVYWKTAKQIPKGAEVYLFVEIMDTGLVHKYPWARLEDIGCLSDHRDALRLGLRFEWNDSGQWKSIQWLYGARTGFFFLLLDTTEKSRLQTVERSCLTLKPRRSSMPSTAWTGTPNGLTTDRFRILVSHDLTL